MKALLGIAIPHQGGQPFIAWSADRPSDWSSSQDFVHVTIDTINPFATLFTLDTQLQHRQNCNTFQNVYSLDTQLQHFSHNVYFLDTR